MSYRKILSLVVFAAGCVLSPFTFGQCQNQACAILMSGCYGCVGTLNSACSVPPRERCSRSCTNTICGATQLAAGKCEPSPTALAQLREPNLILAQLNLNSSPQTGFLIWPGTAQDPTILVSTTHNSKTDLLSAATVRNQSGKTITAYRMGWAMYPRSVGAAAVVREGPIMNVPAGVKPNTDFSVPGQGVSPGLAKSHNLLVFFVASVAFEDGTEWKANTDSITAAYQSGR